MRLFADPTSLTLTGKDLDLLPQRINSDLPAIYKSINPGFKYNQKPIRGWNM